MAVFDGHQSVFLVWFIINRITMIKATNDAAAEFQIQTNPYKNTFLLFGSLFFWMTMRCTPKLWQKYDADRLLSPFMCATKNLHNRNGITVIKYINWELNNNKKLCKLILLSHTYTLCIDVGFVGKEIGVRSITWLIIGMFYCTFENGTHGKCLVSFFGQKYVKFKGWSWRWRHFS